MNKFSRIFLIFLAGSVSNCFGFFGFGKSALDKIEDRTHQIHSAYEAVRSAAEMSYDLPDYKELEVKSAVLKFVARDEKFPYNTFLVCIQKDLQQLEKDGAYLTKRASTLYGTKKEDQKRERDRVLDILSFVEYEYARLENVYVYIKNFHEVHQEKILEMKYKKNSSSFGEKVRKGVLWIFAGIGVTFVGLISSIFLSKRPDLLDVR